MNKSSKEKWSLDPNEISMAGSSGSVGGKRGQFARRLKITSTDWTLTHLPTGIAVSGEVPAGHYSKKEMRQLRDDLYEKLFRDLELKLQNV